MPSWLTSKKLLVQYDTGYMKMQLLTYLTAPQKNHPKKELVIIVTISSGISETTYLLI